MPFVAARYGEGGPAGSFDDRSLGRRRRSLIIVGSRDADEHAGGTREVDEEMDEPRVEKKGYGGEGELGVGPYRVYAHVRKYESGRVIGLSACLCDRAATLLFIELSLMIENHYTLIVRVIRFTRLSAPTIVRAASICLPPLPCPPSDSLSGHVILFDSTVRVF